MNKYSVLIIFVLGLGFAWADWLAVAQCDAEDRTVKLYRSYITKYPKITMMNGNCTECVAEDKFNLATTDCNCPNNIRSWQEKSFPGCELNYIGDYQYSVASEYINY